ncbi:cell division protein FtsQ [Arboricoccus pini]|uniref:Cell division protein FtsQ n=1 Tax=Arboricoccus pini TaxID=1963835 RepID=A0A212QAU8_9PROT|nr:cell division protein FtsQ/DivIB [Arboricoccus pini]SNB56364.1 cell division protein FtsQ [Arboricoccus pini]
MRPLMRPSAPPVEEPVRSVVRENRVPERQKPTPRWVKRLRTFGIVLAAVGIVAGGGYVAIDEGVLAKLQGGLRDGGEVLSAKLGLSVQDAYSEGRHSTNAEALAAVIQPVIGKSIVLLDTEALREQVEHLPWVHSATVKRLLPSTIFVHIEEYNAVALWFDGQETKVVSSDGEVLPVKDLRPFLDLTLLHGEGAPAAAADLLDVLKSEPDLAARVTAAGRVGQRRWNIFLDGRIEVRLPEHDFATAWHRLADYERRNKILARAVDSIDMRSPSWTAVHLKSDEKETNAAPIMAAAEKRGT